MFEFWIKMNGMGNIARNIAQYLSYYLSDSLTKDFSVLIALIVMIELYCSKSRKIGKIFGKTLTARFIIEVQVTFQYETSNKLIKFNNSAGSIIFFIILISISKKNL